MAKRWIPAGTHGHLLTVADFKTLQQDVDALVGQDSTLEKHKFEPNRQELRTLSTVSGGVSEGDLVRVMGFIHFASKQQPESVNCYAADAIDIHINIGAAKADTEFDGIVVEMIPQFRLEDWDPTAKALKRVQQAALPVLVVGSLTYDNETW